MRAALAGALLAEPDLLLLDEPTNYLDLEGALWLESKLKRYPNAALMISHDRDLLNESVDAIVHVIGQKLDLYTGNYDNFERMRAEKARLNAANAASANLCATETGAVLSPSPERACPANHCCPPAVSAIVRLPIH